MCIGIVCGGAGVVWYGRGWRKRSRADRFHLYAYLCILGVGIFGLVLAATIRKSPPASPERLPALLGIPIALLAAVFDLMARRAKQRG